MQRQKGFTLIEMMLVIAVIAIMSALAVMIYHRRAETARIDKVSVEMQHILEAALAYNVDQQKWPDSQDDCSATSPDTTKDFVKDYIPNQDYQSSYGSYFCWSKVGGDDDARLFWVALKVPNNNTALANRIAARLPNAVVTSDLSQEDVVPCNANTCYVRAEVVQPAATSNNQGGGGMVVATGDCPSSNDATNSNASSSTCVSQATGSGSKYKITFNACPTTDLPRVTVFPNQIHYPRDSWPGFTVENIDAERTNEACTTSTGSDGKLKQNCNIAVHVTFCTGSGPYKCSYEDTAQANHPGSAGASYIVACIPKNTPQN